MNKDKLNEWLATEVMEWFVDSSNWTDYYADCETNEFITDCLNWNPDTDPGQALMCLKEFVKNKMKAADFTIMFSNDANPLIQMVDFQGEAIFETHCEYSELPLAICLAIREMV